MGRVGLGWNWQWNLTWKVRRRDSSESRAANRFKPTHSFLGSSKCSSRRGCNSRMERWNDGAMMSHTKRKRTEEMVLVIAVKRVGTKESPCSKVVVVSQRCLPMSTSLASGDEFNGGAEFLTGSGSIRTTTYGHGIRVCCPGLGLLLALTWNAYRIFNAP